MVRAYSMDLREQVVAAVLKESMSARGAICHVTLRFSMFCSLFTALIPGIALHIRTSTAAESTFATVHHRTGKAMAFRLMMSAQVKWRKLDGLNHLPEIVKGIAFKDGIKQP